MIRIIAGQWKRKKILTLEGKDLTRPTSDRVKENLFNILQSHLQWQGLVVLDLFAGSGAIGLECLSRGAQKVYFVDSNRQACQVIAHNLKELAVPKEKYEIWNIDLNQGWSTLASRLLPQSVNLVFADPPYALDWYDGALGHLASLGICAPEALAVFEMNKTRTMPPSLPPWDWQQSRVYGHTKLEFWTMNDKKT